MPEILVTVRDKFAENTLRHIYVCSNSDYQIRFDFDAEWAAHQIKTARFKYGSAYQDVVFTGDICPMPIIENAAVIYVGVYAGDLHTTTAAIIRSSPSILSGNGAPADPPPDIYAQIMAKIDSGVLQGPEGKSAYQIALDHGFVGTEAEWIAAQEKARVDSEAAAEAARNAQNAAEAARDKATEAQSWAAAALTGATEAAQEARGAANTATQEAEKAQTSRKEAETAQAGAQAAKTAAETAQAKAEEAAQRVAEDREQIGANKTDIESTREELAATKAALAATQKDLGKAQRAIKFQAELNQGQTWDFETDTQEAYQRQVPSGAKAGAVMAVGGKTVVWNQIADDWGKVVKSQILYFPKGQTITAGHKYLISCGVSGEDADVVTQVIMCYKPENEKPEQIGKISSTGAGKKNGIVTAAKSGISNLADNITGSVWVYVYQPNGGVDNIKIIDLTILYGSGNEPTDTTDPRIAQIAAYAAANPEYNAGELLPAQVDEVRVAGKNVARPLSVVSKSGVTMSVDKDGIYHFSGTASANFSVRSESFDLPGGTYTVSINAATPFNVYMSISSLTSLMVGTNTMKTGKFEGGRAFVYFYIRKNVVMDNVSIAFQCERGSTPTAYSPYRDPITYPIPSAVQALPGYGWSAGSVANTIERTENGWQYVQRVGSRAYQEGDKLTDGTTTYYALEAPIPTDITALMGDALAPFAVETGGSITLHHPKADDGFTIDVPAKIQYITKLSEVSANG